MEGFPNYSAILMQVVGFGALYWLLSSFFFGPVGRLLEDRERIVRERLDDAEAQRAKMIGVRQDYERRVAQIETEARNRIQQAIHEAHQARDELLAQARSEYDRLLERAKKDVEYEIQKARDDIKRRVAEVAILVAGRIVEKNLDAAAHEGLIDDVLNEVEGVQRA